MKKLFILILVLISVDSFSQLYQVLPQYGYQMPRVDARLVLKIPSDTTTNKTGVARIGTVLYAGNGTYWTAAGGTAGWGLTGNASTVAGTNFIGTTDAVGLMFKTAGVQSGFIDIPNNNTSLGYESLLGKTNGTDNTAFGSYALKSLTTGTDNTALGVSALTATTGQANIGLGHFAGSFNTSESNRLYINSLGRSDIGGDTTQSIIYGAQDATAANQRLYLNSQVYLPYTTAAANAADSMMVILPSTGKVGYRAIPAGGGTPALTATYIGYGDGSNLLTGSGGFVTDGSGTATLSTALTSPTLRGSTAANGDLLIDGTSSATKASSYVDIQQVGGYVGINTASSSNNLAVPLHIGNGTYNPSVDPVLLINRTITGTSGNAHGFVDASHVVRSGTIGYNSYDAFPRLGEGYGIGFDHYAAFQARPIFNETGQSISDIYGLYSTMTNTAGTVNNYYAGYAANPSNSGTLTNNYGFYTASLTSGVNNYAFYSAGTTPSYFGGAVSMNTTATVTTSLRTPLLIGSTSANGTITLQGNNAGASNTGTNDNIIFNVGNTPTKAGAFLNNGTLKLGTTGINGRIDLTRTADGVTIGSLYQNASQTTLNTESSLRLTWGGNSIVNMGSVGLVVDHTSTTVTATSTLQTAGSFATAYRAITALRTLDATDHTINCTANTFTVTLPTAASITGRQYTIVNSGSGTITIGTTSSQTFANINATPTTLTLAPVGVGAIVSYTVVSNGANWIVTGKVKDE